jgi:hypothetical protein
MRGHTKKNNVVSFAGDKYDSFAREQSVSYKNENNTVSKLTKIKQQPKQTNTQRPVFTDNTNKLVQDEFIKNLQQQLYFMELEIKLLKERESERDSLTGLELTDGQPLNENMIQFKAKYQTTKTKYEQQIADLKEKIKKLDHKSAH